MTTMYAKTRSTIRRVTDRTRRLAAGLARASTHSLAIGALLLTTASTASVVATANTPPIFTSLTLSKTTVYEGETVTLSGSFTDPDTSNRHTMIIYWYGGEGEDLQDLKEKVQIPAGQRSFQYSHTYGDHVTIPFSSIKVVLFDHEFPTNPNDNTTGIAHDTELVPFQFLDAKAQFAPSSIKITKHDAGSKLTKPTRSVLPEIGVTVTIDGDLTPREALEPVQVTASWNGAASLQEGCSMKDGSRHFQCEHTYTSPSPLKGFPVTLRVKDDEGNQAAHQLSVHVP